MAPCRAAVQAKEIKEPVSKGLFRLGNLRLPSVGDVELV